MASILDGTININPTITEAGCKITVVLMASEAHHYLYTANWPDYIRCLLFGMDKKALNVKEFQKYAHNIENMLRDNMGTFHIDTIHTELEAFVGAIFSDVHVTSTGDNDDIYYCCNNEGKIILIVAVTRPVA